MGKTNRKQFITELSKYLASMTPEEQDAIINRYELRFDEAGSEGEQALLDSLGSPMKVAIALFREHNSGASNSNDSAPEPDAIPDAGTGDTPAPLSAEPAAEAAPAVPKAEEAVADAPDPTPNFISVETDVISVPDKPEDRPLPEEAEVAPTVTEDDEFDLDDEDDEDNEPDEADAPGPAANGAAVVGSVALCVVTVIVGLALMALPVGAVYLGIRSLISGFASFAYLPDTLLLLGIGAVSTGIGLAVAWLIVWMAVTVLKALRRRILIRTGRLTAREGGPEI